MSKHSCLLGLHESSCARMFGLATAGQMWKVVTSVVFHTELEQLRSTQYTPGEGR